tara:strand:- start:1769 stop:1975 length:207 start_codon:yes stop_codon:yes gene_type:complete
MKYIALAECVDCPPTPVIDETYISVVEINDEYLGVTRCQWCRRPIQYWMLEEDALILEELGVDIITWV